MGENSAIQWTDHTWNPWQGCHKLSAACQNCYMFRDKKRYGQDPETVRRSSNSTFRLPYKLPKKPAKVFVCSWSDFFIEEADQWRDEAWNVIRQNPHLTFQLVTKRTHLIADRLPKDWGNGYPNVWLIATVENQEMAEKRIPELLSVPAIVHGLSIEPMLGPINLVRWLDPTGIRCQDVCRDTQYILPNEVECNDLGEPYCPNCGLLADFTGYDPGIDWVICGGESGPNARPMHPDWARSLRDQCQTSGVSFFLKQMSVNGKTVKMPELDGRVWSEFPNA